MNKERRLKKLDESKCRIKGNLERSIRNTTDQEALDEKQALLRHL